MATEVKRVRLIPKSERAELPTAQTPGIRREQAIADDHLWLGTVETEPNKFSGWHHHGEYDTYAYIISGRARVEFGPGGREHADGGPDDFIHIPKWAVHREGNPDPTPLRAVLVRIGSGQSLFNVEGPEA